jgi:hypothetical protein
MGFGISSIEALSSTTRDVILSRREYESVDWIHPAQRRVWWWALVNRVMSPQVPKKAENFLTSCMTIRLCSMELVS